MSKYRSSTSTSTSRSLTAKFRSGYFAWALTAAATIATTVSTQATPQKASWHSIAAIEAAALQHIKRSQAGSSYRTESRVKALDRRLKLASCGTKLETFLPSNTNPGAIQTVGVRCSKPRPWKIYVPVTTVTYRKVVVASRPLRRGTIVGQGDVRLEERDINRIQNRYLTTLAQLEGRILKRDVQPDAIISQNNLDAQDIVKRGQRIMLLARNSKMNVRMRGEALSSAAKDERIRVKNLSSQRIIEGVVQSSQIVLVDY